MYEHKSINIIHDDEEEIKEPPVAVKDESLFWSGSVGQAAALACSNELLGTRITVMGQFQFGFENTHDVRSKAAFYFENSLQVDALTFWDKMYEFKAIKYNKTIIKNN